MSTVSRLDELINQSFWTVDQADAAAQIWYEAACLYSESGDVADIENACGSLGAFGSTADRLVDWCQGNGIVDPLPLWAAYLSIDYCLDGDKSVTLEEVSKRLDLAVIEFGPYTQGHW